MKFSANYSPVPVVLTSPESLDELMLLMTRLTSGCRVMIPALKNPIDAVHGGYASRISPSPHSVVFRNNSRSVVMLELRNRELAREWFRKVWIPLHLAAIEGDDDDFFS